VTWRVEVCDLDDLANPLGVVANYQSFLFEDPLSDFGSGQCIFEAGTVPDTWLQTNTYWRFEHDGVRRFGFVLEVVEDFPVSDDERNLVKASGRGPAAVLDWAVILPENYPTGKKTTRTWTLRSYPDVLAQLLDEAVARGTLAMLTRDWTSSADTDTITWGNAVDGEQETGPKLSELITRWAALHPFDWHMDVDFQLSLWLQAGTDKTATVVMHPGGAVRKMETTRSRRELANHIYVEDTQGNLTDYDDTDSITAWGRRETYLKPAEAINEFTSSAIAYPLLTLRGAEQVERVAEVGPVVGRQPWVDFGHGDIIGVHYTDGVIRPHRVVAITAAADENGNEAAEAVLDTVLKPGDSSTSQIGEGVTGGIGGTSVLLYSENDSSVTIQVAQQTMCPMVVQAKATTNGRAGINIKGTASAAMTVTIEVLAGTVVGKTYPVEIPAAGVHTIGIPFIAVGIPEGTQTWMLRVKTSTGTFTVQVAGDAAWWIESKDLAGGLGATDPNVVVDDTVTDHPLTATDAVIAATQTPVGDSVSESAPQEPHTAADSTAVNFGFGGPSAAAGDDGWVNPPSTFTSTGNTVEMGNSGGTTRAAWFRFAVAPPLSGTTILSAKLTLTPDTTMAGTLRTKIAVDVGSGSPTGPSSYADFTGRTRSTSKPDWDVTSSQVVAGTAITTVDFAAAVQEVVTAFGSITQLLVLIDDDGSDTTGRLVARSVEHATTATRPQLTVQYV
jgi:hypothetical protein